MQLKHVLVNAYLQRRFLKLTKREVTFGKGVFLGTLVLNSIALVDVFEVVSATTLRRGLFLHVLV